MRAALAMAGTSSGRAYSRSIRSRARRRWTRSASSAGVMRRGYPTPSFAIEESRLGAGAIAFSGKGTSAGREAAFCLLLLHAQGLGYRAPVGSVLPQAGDPAGQVGLGAGQGAGHGGKAGEELFGRGIGVLLGPAGRLLRGGV